MSPHPTPTPNDPAQQAADTQFYRQSLHDFITMATNLARALHDQATPQPQPAPAPTPSPDLIATTAAFDRLARAVRRSILLARTLTQPPAPARDPAQLRADARKRILRETEDTIQRAHNPDSDAAEALQTELRERLDTPDLEDDLTHRPVAEIITEIRRDLGLDAHPGTRPFKRRTPKDIGDLAARAAAPSRPHPATTPLGNPHVPQPSATPGPAPPGRTIIPSTPVPAHDGAGPPGSLSSLIATFPHPPPQAPGRWRPPREA